MPRKWVVARGEEDALAGYAVIVQNGYPNPESFSHGGIPLVILLDSGSNVTDAPYRADDRALLWSIERVMRSEQPRGPASLRMRAKTKLVVRASYHFHPMPCIEHLAASVDLLIYALEGTAFLTPLSFIRGKLVS